jgi:hypothetical protein
MESSSSHRVVAAERLDGGVIITFDDGKCAFYTAALLHATLAQARIVEQPEDDHWAGDGEEQ